MKNVTGLLTLSALVIGLSVNAFAETKRERLVREQEHKIDQEAKAKKEKAMDKNSGSAWRGGAKKQQDEERKIDREAAEKKKQAREAAAKLGPKADEKYDAKKDKRKNRPNID